MKARSFKKFFVSIALSAVLTLSSASSVFAAAAQLAPAEQSVELAQSDDSDPRHLRGFPMNRDIRSRIRR